MAIGVPETDVFQAADRVLARGERPTVERVRAELGRGSPARVGHLLEQWWDKLAKRLVGETRFPELPSEVAAAFKTTWSVASEHAATGAQQSVASAKAQIETERESLATERSRWAADLESARAAEVIAVEARQVVEQRLADHQGLIQQLQAELQDVIGQRDKVQRHADAMEQEILALGAKIEKLEKAHSTERGRAAEHIRSVEDRAHAEVDRARSETKTLRTLLTESDRARRAADQAALKVQREHAGQVRTIEREATAQRARADALEAQLARMTRPTPSRPSTGRRKARKEAEST